MNNRIIQVRELLRMSPCDFSDELGVSEDTLEKWENGSETLSFETLQKFSANFNINLNWLISGEGYAYTSTDYQTSDSQTTKIVDNQKKEVT